MSETKIKLVNIIDQLESRDLKETEISHFLDDMVELLSENESETISIMEELNENQVSWLLTTFDELTFAFQSQDFVNTLDLLAEKYPDIEGIEDYVSAAKEVMEE